MIQPASQKSKSDHTTANISKKQLTVRETRREFNVGANSSGHNVGKTCVMRKGPVGSAARVLCVLRSRPAALGGDDGVSAAAEMAINIVLRIGRGSACRSRFHLAFRCAATPATGLGSAT